MPTTPHTRITPSQPGPDVRRDDVTHAAPVRTPAITSRLPDVGTTIFTTMSALASQHRAINLGQGFPDFDCDPALIGAVTQAMGDGHNQYRRWAGCRHCGRR